MSSATPSIEGNNYALVITDDASMYRANIRARYVLQIPIRDNAGELRSADLNTFIESLGVKNYFSVAYEQYQNGPAESSIHSLSLLSRTQMVESGLMGKFWYRALVNAKDTRNATYPAIPVASWVLPSSWDAWMLRRG